MSIFNRVQLICNLGSEPKIINSNQTNEFVILTAASNESYRQNEEWKTHTEWHNLVAFGNIANYAKSLKKGEQLFVEGKLRSNKWTDKNGIQRTSINIVVQSIHPISRSTNVNKNDSENVNNDVGNECLAQMYDALSNSIPTQ